jgi:hypothetical protein
MFISYFETVKDQVPKKKISVEDVYRLITADPGVKKATDRICTDHKEGIFEGFETIDKGQYQQDKTRKLSAILPAGQVDTRQSELSKIDFKPSGLICLDIDENTPDKLRQFYKSIPTASAGACTSIVLSALSVSGRLNGSFMILVRVQLPKRFNDIPKKLINKLNLKKTDPFAVTLDKLNKAYHQAFSHVLHKDGINAGKAGKSIKNVRYLAHDPNAYFNNDAKELSFKWLLLVLGRMTEADQDVERFTGEALDITETDAIRFAERFAEKKGYQFVKGQRHDYLARFAIAANLLGLSKSEAEKYAENMIGGKITTNCISGPYSRYKDSAGIWAYKLEENKHRTIVEGQAGQKLSDLIKPDQIFDKWIISPTGSGKTFLVDQVEGRKVIVCPTLALVDDVCSQYNAVPFVGSKKKDFQAIKQADFIATTYASFRKLSAYLWEFKDDIRIFIDEGHNMTASASPGFQLKQLHEVLTNAKQFKSVTLLTGTWLYNHDPYLKELDRIIVKIPRPDKKLFLVDCKGSKHKKTGETKVLKTASEAIRRSISNGRFPLVLFDNTSEDGRLGTLKMLLNDVPGLRYFSSHTKQDEDFKSITEEGTIKDDVKGIVTTSVLKEGNNILNEKDFDIIIIGSYHSAQIEQFSNRPRQAKSINIYILRSDSRTTSDRSFSAQSFAAYIEKRAQTACDELNTPDYDLDDSEMYAKELSVRQSVVSNPIRYDDDQAAYVIDYLHLSFITFAQQQKAEYRNDQLMIKNLAQYGIVFDSVLASDAIITTAEKDQAAALRKKAKEAEENEYNATLDLISKQADPAGYASQQINHKSDDLTKVQKIAFERFCRLYDLIPAAAGIIDQMRSIGPKKAKFVLFYKRLKLYLIRQDKSYMASNRNLAIILKAVDEKLPAGALLTSEEINERIRQLLKLDKGFDLSYLDADVRHTKHFQIAKLFVDLKRKDQRNSEGKKVVKYQICTLIFDGIINNTLQNKGTNNRIRPVEEGAEVLIK